MDCRAFRSYHGDWVDDVLDPRQGETLARHIAECASCARFDTLARRALMVARSAPQIEVSADFSARLSARIADERRARIAEHKPSHVERARPVRRGATWVRAAAAVIVITGGTLAMRSTAQGGMSSSAMLPGSDARPVTTDDASAMPASYQSASYLSAIPGGSSGRIVVVSSMRPVGGALLPFSDDPLLDGDDRASLGDVSATSVAATAPLWPTAQMAAHAAHRFAAMEFGDVMPVSVMHTSR